MIQNDSWRVDQPLLALSPGIAIPRFLRAFASSRDNCPANRVRQGGPYEDRGGINPALHAG